MSTPGGRALAALATGLSICSLAACFIDAQGTTEGPERCNSEPDCPDPGPCAERRCSDGFCVPEPVPDGLAPNQTAGDCQTASCVAGEVTLAADSADVDDGRSCTEDACQASGPVHQLLPEGTPCEFGTVVGSCSPDGDCLVECSPTVPCPDGDPCFSKACVDQVCVYSPVSGEPVVPTPDRVDGDCKRPFCQDGSLIQTEDGSDLPIEDGLACTNGVCSGSTPAQDPLPAGTPCGVGLVCDATGNCDGCTSNGQCGAPSDCTTPTCTAAFDCVDVFAPPHTPCTTGVCKAGGACVQCADQTDCGALAECSYFTCDNDACTPHMVSAGSACLLTASNRCNAAGQCVACLSVADCPAATACVGQTCTAAGACMPANVPVGDPCLLGVGVCNAAQACVGCVDISDCPAPPVCRVATCIGQACGTALAPTGSVCPTGFCSATGTCVECTQPSHCTLPEMCCMGTCKPPPCP